MELVESFSVVIPILNPLQITTANPLPGATVGSAYSLQFTEAYGVLPVTWSLSSVQSGTFASVLNAGQSGNAIGYATPFYGSLAPTADMNGNTVNSIIYATTTTNLSFSLTSASALTQSYFLNLTVGANSLASSAAGFSSSGVPGNFTNTWLWTAIGSPLISGKQYGVVYL